MTVYSPTVIHLRRKFPCAGKCTIRDLLSHFSTPSRFCSVDTELVDGNVCANPTDLLLEIRDVRLLERYASSFLLSGSTDLRAFSCAFHTTCFFTSCSEERPMSLRESVCLTLDFRRVRNTHVEVFITLQRTDVIVHRHEDDPMFEFFSTERQKLGDEMLDVEVSEMIWGTFMSVKMKGQFISDQITKNICVQPRTDLEQVKTLLDISQSLILSHRCEIHGKIYDRMEYNSMDLLLHRSGKNQLDFSWVLRTVKN